MGHQSKQHQGGGLTMFSTLHITRAEPKILKNSWRLRSDHDGGSGGHLLGQRRMQVREKATGDLLVFILVKNSPSAFTFFCESESFLIKILVQFYYHVQSLIRIRLDRKYS